MREGIGPGPTARREAASSTAQRQAASSIARRPVRPLALRLCMWVGLFAPLSPTAWAQVPPTATEIAAYGGLHAAAQRGDRAGIERLVRGAGGAVPARRDRTPPSG